MTARLPFFQASQKIGGKLFELAGVITGEIKDKELYELVHMLTSYLNGCTFCIDLGVKQGRKHGINEMKLFHVAAWRDSQLFSEKERALFEWTEVVTKLDRAGVSDELYDRVRSHFSEKEISDLTFA
ncbi:MAG: carboxymuconolactone decarboxylase family protein, partial [Proteobacteria bacterium]